MREGPSEGHARARTELSTYLTNRPLFFHAADPPRSIGPDTCGTCGPKYFDIPPEKSGTYLNATVFSASSSSFRANMLEGES